MAEPGPDRFREATDRAWTVGHVGTRWNDNATAGTRKWLRDCRAGDRPRRPSSLARATWGRRRGVLMGLKIVGPDLRSTRRTFSRRAIPDSATGRAASGWPGCGRLFNWGAESVVATVWQIPDGQSAQLMISFSTTSPTAGTQRSPSEYATGTNQKSSGPLWCRASVFLSGLYTHRKCELIVPPTPIVAPRLLPEWNPTVGTDER